MEPMRFVKKRRTLSLLELGLQELGAYQVRSDSYPIFSPRPDPYSPVEFVALKHLMRNWSFSMKIL